MSINTAGHTDHDRTPTVTAARPEHTDDIWSTLLDNVASSKSLPQKNLIVLGGTRQQQDVFIDSLVQQSSTKGPRQIDRTRNERKTPRPNETALGYTYQDVYDVDHDDVLARLSIYTLSECSSAYVPLVARQLTSKSVQSTAIAVLLDWSQPWTFARALRDWIRFLREVVQSVPDNVTEGLEANNALWIKTRNQDSIAASSVADLDAALPLTAGEFEDPLGLPIVVVCHDTQAIEHLEREQGYRESHLDYVQQFLRSVLMAHGAGLIFTMPNATSSADLQALLHRILRIGTIGPGDTLSSRRNDVKIKYNVVDAERILVPPGWDTASKIQTIKESFDVQGLIGLWSVETTLSNELYDHTHPTEQVADDLNERGISAEPSAISTYERHVPDPRPRPRKQKGQDDVQHVPEQEFLALQLEKLEVLRTKELAEREQQDQNKKTASVRSSDSPSATPNKAVTDSIGPVQFNMGGIQYDAEEALRQLRERTLRATAGSGFQTPERRFAGGDSSVNTPLTGGTGSPAPSTGVHTPSGPSFGTPTFGAGSALDRVRASGAGAAAAAGSGAGTPSRHASAGADVTVGGATGGGATANTHAADGDAGIDNGDTNNDDSGVGDHTADSLEGLEVYFASLKKGGGAGVGGVNGSPRSTASPRA